MEKLMIKAIRDFKKKYRHCEIRSIYVAESWGCFGNVLRASFCIDYVNESCGEYKTAYFIESSEV